MTSVAPLRIALVGSSKTKLDRPTPAAQLYTGALFQAAARYAAGTSDRSTDAGGQNATAVAASTLLQSER